MMCYYLNVQLQGQRVKLPFSLYERNFSSKSPITSRKSLTRSSSLSLCLESYIFFSLFSVKTELCSFIPLESLFTSSSRTAPSSMHQTCAGIIQYILRVRASPCWGSIMYSRLHHICAKRTQRTDYFDTWPMSANSSVTSAFVVRYI